MRDTPKTVRKYLNTFILRSILFQPSMPVILLRPFYVVFNVWEITLKIRFVYLLTMNFVTFPKKLIEIFREEQIYFSCRIYHKIYRFQSILYEYTTISSNFLA